MGVRFACHACGRRLNVKQQLAGRRGRCPKCGVWFRVPAKDAETSLSVDDDPLRWIDEHPNAQWYVRPPSGGQYGPASGALLRHWISEGRVGADSLLWRDGWPQWREATQMMPDRFVPAPAPPPIALPPAPPIAPRPAPPIAPQPAAEPPVKQVALRQPPEATRLPTAAGMLDDTAVEAKILEQASAAASDRPPEPPGKVRRQRTSRRTMIVAVLLALSLLLLLALVVVLVLQPPAVEV